MRATRDGLNTRKKKETHKHIKPFVCLRRPLFARTHITGVLALITPKSRVEIFSHNFSFRMKLSRLRVASGQHCAHRNRFPELLAQKFPIRPNDCRRCECDNVHAACAEIFLRTRRCSSGVDIATLHLSCSESR